jgi:hypothetical protein
MKLLQLSKEKGFISRDNLIEVNSDYKYLWMCELKKWLRDNHNIHTKVDDFLDDETGIEWDFEIVLIGTDLDEKGNYTPLVSYSMDDNLRKFKSYEDALEEGLFEALNFCGEKN